MQNLQRKLSNVLGADDAFGNTAANEDEDPFTRNEYIHRQVENFNLAPPIYIQRKFTDERQNIVRICLTGGPCAGKTTAIADIKQDLTQLGMKVLVVPEAATILMKGGAFIVSSGFTESQGLMF